MIRVSVPVIVLAAAAQALLVWPAVTPGTSGAFVGLAAASFLVATIATWLLAEGASASARSTPFRPGWRGLLWSAVAIAATVIAAVLSIFAVPFVITAALFVLPAAVDPSARLLDGFRALGREPIRFVVMALLTILVVFVAWVLALVFGLFLTGWIGAAVTWLVFGILAAVLLRWWTGQVRRAA